MSEVTGNTASSVGADGQSQNVDNTQENVDKSTQQTPQQGDGVKMTPDGPGDVAPNSMNEHYVQDEGLLADIEVEKPETTDTKKEETYSAENPPSLDDILGDDSEDVEPEKKEPKDKEQPKEDQPQESEKEDAVKPEPKESTEAKTEVKVEDKSILEQAAEATETKSEEEGEQGKPNPLKERLLKSFADKEYASDDDVVNHAIEVLDDLEDFKTRNQEANKVLVDLFTSNEDLLNVVGDMAKGASFRTALARNLDLNGLEAQKGDPDYDEWKKASDERLTKAQEREARIKALEDNQIASEQEINAFIKEKGLSKDEADEFLKKVDETLSPLTENRVGTNFLGMMYTALNHDKEVEQAANTASLKAKNEKIVADRQKRSEPKGDGLPHIQSQGTPPDAKSGEDSLLETIIDEAASREREVYGKRR